jgi:hypothetical protein
LYALEKDPVEQNPELRYPAATAWDTRKQKGLQTAEAYKRAYRQLVPTCKSRPIDSWDLEFQTRPRNSGPQIVSAREPRPIDSFARNSKSLQLKFGRGLEIQTYDA